MHKGFPLHDKITEYILLRKEQIWNVHLPADTVSSQ